MAKLYGGAALEIGSAAIPFGGAARLGGTVALKVPKTIIAKQYGCSQILMKSDKVC